MNKQLKNYLVSFGVFLILAVAAFLIFDNLYSQKQTGKQVEENMSNSIEGLAIEVLQQGQGEDTAQAGDLVTVNYTGYLEDGTKFDSSLDRNEPFTFPLGQNQVIQGWEKGIVGMQVGEKRKLTIAPELAYGEQGTPGGPIPPNATLIFEVELLNIRHN